MSSMHASGTFLTISTLNRTCVGFDQVLRCGRPRPAQPCPILRFLRPDGRALPATI